jgi:thiol-disulfide isomerase/thioredoxin
MPLRNFMSSSEKQMKWYSRSKSDFRERLIKKYTETPVYTVTKNKMKECVLVTTSDCSKCRFVKPHLEKWCKENWYKFKEMEYWPWMDEVTSVPCAMIWEDVILDNEWILELITNKKSFY